MQRDRKAWTKLCLFTAALAAAFAAHAEVAVIKVGPAPARMDLLKAGSHRYLRYADYNTGSVKSRWWVDKSSQVVLSEESKQDDGSMFIKTLLPPEAADAG